MRPMDRAECLALGADPYTVLAESRERSHQSWEVWRGDDLLCEWGWRSRSFVLGEADVWLLSFTPVDRHRVYFARESQRWMEILLTQFRVLRCEVHVEHSVAMRWLLWLGFHSEASVVRNGAVFIIMRRDSPWVP